MKTWDKKYWVGIGGRGLSLRLCGYDKEFGYAVELFELGELEEKTALPILQALQGINQKIGCWIILAQEEEI